MFLWTDAYQSSVSGGDIVLLDPKLQTELALVYLHFRQMERYGQKLIDLRGMQGAEKSEEEFLILMDQATVATLKFISKAIEVIDAELMKTTRPTGWKRRIARATRFVGLSMGLFVVVLFTWLYNKLMDAYLTTPAQTWYEYWLAYLAFGAVFFWIVSRLSPDIWKNVARMVGWDEKDQK